MDFRVADGQAADRRAAHEAASSSPSRVAARNGGKSKFAGETMKGNQAFGWLTRLAKGSFCSLPNFREFLPFESLVVGHTAGRGAYAVVKTARFADVDEESATKYAVKQLKPAVAKDNVELRCFLLEAHLLARLTHENIVDFRGFGLQRMNDVRTGFYVMEFCPGGSMKSLMMKHISNSMRQPLYSLDDALRWSLQLTSAISFMHAQGVPIVHRDIKLDNILLTDVVAETASIKLSDFGLAIQLETDKQVLKHTALTKLRQNGIITRMPTFVDDGDKQEGYFDLTGQSGSLLYMAPEVFLNLPYNEKADVFSIGVVLFELFSGTMLSELVLKEKTWNEATEFAKKVAKGHRTRIPQHIHPAVAQLIESCWQQDPRKRPAAVEVLQVLQEVESTRVIFEDAPDNMADRWNRNPQMARHTSWVSRSVSKMARALARRLSM